MTDKLFNVYGTIGRYDKNYHVIAVSASVARKMIKALDPELHIRSITVETRKLFAEMGEPLGAYIQAYAKAFESDDGIYLYDEGT